MSDIWFISDLHCFHKNILSFKNYDGSLLRPEFAPQDPDNPDEVSRCLKHYHDALLSNINRMVKSGDKLYNLGDTTLYHGDAFKQWYSKIDTRQHRLLIGNHDDPVKLVQMNIFKKVGIWRKFNNENFTATHVPVHADSLRTDFCVHGHLHGPKVVNADGTENLRYINVCVEHTNYHPVNIDQIVEVINKRKKGIPNNDQ